MSLAPISPWRRIRQEPKLWQKIYWWLIRICFIYGLICTVCWHMEHPPAFALLITAPAQVDATKLLLMMIVHLPVTFLWEIFQFLPEKSIFRFVPAYFQNFSAPFALATGFMGAFVNWYYDMWWWDKVIHFLGGGLCIILGYELFSAMQRRRKVTVPMSILLWACFGMCFIVGTVWELFEFSFDEFFGGDTQHWNLVLAEAAGMAKHVFPPPVLGGEFDAASYAWQWEHRFALMDTMGDIIMNTAGGVLFIVPLRIFPYHHRGPNNLNRLSPVPAEAEGKIEITV
ncbi:MAG: hypothetical protein LBJ11_09775 [Oscillospiraceae bacterium]|jgi:hypothetical protein|nr:hypothetical protein [Oscillospiraceae bacterium]